ncbi:sensor histidine kinase [Cohnella sp. GCM10027633]|uniref:cache domain-containing sensor histidine kinase n=1 Tax=unclassified Cohnella TaxID=2636738 RepID=UPI003637B9D8
MLKRLFRTLTPGTFKNRILLAFVVFLLLPIAMLVAYNFSETERMLQADASAKNIEQLEGIKTDLVDLMSLVMKTGMLLEQDSTLRSAMINPDQYNQLTRKRLVENKFAGIENSFFLTGATVYYTLIDLNGNVYTSFTPQNALVYDEITAEPWVQELRREGGERYAWNPQDDNDVTREWTTSRKMLSLYQLLRDEGLKPYGYGRFSIDYEQWFDRTTAGLTGEAAYFLLDAAGNAMLSSAAGETLSASALKGIAQSRAQADASSVVDGDTLYSFSRIQGLDGYLVKKMPLSALFHDVDRQKQRFYIGYGAILLLFVLLTYLISATITVPLKLFQKKMERSVKSNLKVKLPEEGRGEILALTQSFNAMIDDINALLERLQLEERQKQYVRFQVLLSQMNPHFLLNTLNTIKSIALDKDDDDIYEICVALGKILETTLNTEVDLILLKDELVLIESYMDIQRRRFGHGIALEYDVDEELRYALIPKFCLQPLVENSLLHGFGQTGAEGIIRIRVWEQNRTLYLEVADNGVGIDRAKERKVVRKRKSIGVQNIRETLELMFKNQSTGLRIQSTDEGTQVQLHMPMLLSKPYAKEGNGNVENADRG